MNGFITDWVRHHARTTPSRRAVVDLSSRRQRSYRELDDRVGRIARVLLDLNVGPGDRVGVLSLNSTDVLEIVLATWRVGAIYLALNFRLTAKELGFIIGDAEPVAMFADTTFADTVAGLRADDDGIAWIAMDGSGGDTEFERRIAGAAPVADPVTADPADPCMLMYSSGTTGTPKGVVITHGMILAALVNGIAFGVGPEIVSYAALPLFHIAAIMGFSLPALFAGGTAVIERQFDPDRFFDAIGDRELGITHFFLVPAIWAGLRAHPRATTTDYSGIQGAFGGAESLPPALIQWWFQRGVPIREVYGMTETTGGATVIQAQDVPGMAGSAGKTLLLVEARIVQPDGRPAATGEPGELWLRGPTVLGEYWRRPEATAEALVEGWLRTGDIARRDADGYFYIEDRLKDMYISGGENVYPAEVEAVLYQRPEIREVAVIGIPDPRWGEAGCAIVALNEGAREDEAALRAYCTEHLAKYKHPARYVFVDELPRNATGKVLKFELRRRFGKSQT